MYGTQHMTNPTTFYSREDRREVPRELYRDREIGAQPYYVMARLDRGIANPFWLGLKTTDGAFDGSTEVSNCSATDQPFDYVGAANDADDLTAQQNRHAFQLALMH